MRFRALALPVAFAAAALALAPRPALPSNLNTHAGGAEAVNADPYFVAGAILADLNHYLPTSYQTDTAVIAGKLLAHAVTPHEHQFALGWYEHVDQDGAFSAAVAAAQAHHRRTKRVLHTSWVGSPIPHPVFSWTTVDDGPRYSVLQIRLAFDAMTLRSHPAHTLPLFVVTDDAILDLIVVGLDGQVSKDQVKTAILRSVFQVSLTDPGLIPQAAAAYLYGVLLPGAIHDLSDEYAAYWSATTAAYYQP
ncbi:MAG: hypothetical protein HYZ53_15965 [Planctomycetes bacterium]|nr:hypothetical protein [Planctomycetota bacterium]